MVATTRRAKELKACADDWYAIDWNRRRGAADHQSAGRFVSRTGARWDKVSLPSAKQLAADDFSSYRREEKLEQAPTMFRVIARNTRFSTDIYSF